MSEATLVIVGNLVKDPELRFLPSGQAVVNFTVARTPRKFNRDTKQWENGEAIFIPCTAWAELAENIANSLSKGHNVIVTGELRSRTYDTREGDKRTVHELNVENIGASLSFATVQITKQQRTANGIVPAGSTPPASSGATGGGSARNDHDEPPF